MSPCRKNLFLYLSKVTGLISTFIFVSSASGQAISGQVVDATTGEALPYVHVGIAGKNVGAISRDNGQFLLNVHDLNDSELIIFSMVGYEKSTVLIRDIGTSSVIKLKPAIFQLNEITVVADKIIELRKLGRPETTKLTIGHSGTDVWGTGSEWGLKIPANDEQWLLRKVAFHTRFNTVDSILFRVNIYAIAVDTNMPGESLLKRDIYVKSRKKDKWIIGDIEDHRLITDTDFAVTIEIIRLWYKEGNENQLFFTYGKDTPHLTTFSREASLAPWLLDKMPPIALYVEAQKLSD